MTVNDRILDFRAVYGHRNVGPGINWNNHGIQHHTTIFLCTKDIIDRCITSKLIEGQATNDDAGWIATRRLTSSSLVMLRLLATSSLVIGFLF
jgi:hypothetical protein